MTPHLPPSVARLVSLLYGPGALAGGPFSLLGLEIATPTPEAVEAALAGRLDVLRRHSLAAAHEGVMLDEALRLTAGKLVDPATRDHLVARWKPMAAAVVSAAASSSVAKSDSIAQLEDDARVLLALGSGWSPAVFRRLAWMAHARGIPSSQIVPVIRRVALNPTGRDVPPPPAHKAGGASREFGSDSPAHRTREPAIVVKDVDRWSERKRATLIVSAVALVSLLISAVSIGLIVSHVTQAETPTVAGGASGDADAVAPATSADAADQLGATFAGLGQPSAGSQGEVVQGESVLARLRIATVTPDRDAGAIATAALVPELAVEWIALDAATRRSVVAELVDLVYTAGAGGRDALVAAIREPAAEHAAGVSQQNAIQAVAFSCGMLARLGQERDLPAGVARTVRTTLEAALGADHPGRDVDFSGAARAALASLIVRMAPIAEVPGVDGDWMAWSTAAGAASELRSQRDALLLVALGRLCERAPEPTLDAASLAAIRQVTSEIDWTERSPRQWLVGAFADPAVSSADLYAITGLLARQTATLGIDMAMVVPPMANELRRAEIRDMIASQWGVREGYARDELVLTLVSAAQAALDATAGELTPEQSLAAAFRLVLCILAARRLTSGFFDAAVAAMERADAVVVRGGPSRSRPTRLDVNRDGEWARRYLSAGRHIGNRLELLQELEARAGDTIGPIDADVLLAEAFRGSPSDVRRLAQNVAANRRDDPWVLAAALDTLPTAPSTVAVARLVGELSNAPAPRLESPRWRTVARTRLVERTLALFAAEGTWASIDLLAEDFARLYEERSRPSPTPTDAPRGGEPPAADLSASLMRARVRDQALAALPAHRAPSGLDRIDAERAARLRLVDGPLQRLVVEQRALAGAMAVLVGSERPAAAEAAAAVLDDLARACTVATHVLEQVAACERAILRLWLLRLGEELG